MQLHSTCVSKKGHGISPKRPAGLAWDVGLDFSYVSRHWELQGNRNWPSQTEEEPSSYALGSGSMEELTVSQAQSSPMGEFEQKLNDPNGGPIEIRFGSDTG